MPFNKRSFFLAATAIELALLLVYGRSQYTENCTNVINTTQTLARLTGSVDPYSRAAWLLKDLCDRIISPTQPASIRRTSTTATASTKVMRRAQTWARFENCKC